MPGAGALVVGLHPKLFSLACVSVLLAARVRLSSAADNWCEEKKIIMMRGKKYDGGGGVGEGVNADNNNM